MGTPGGEGEVQPRPGEGKPLSSPPSFPSISAPCSFGRLPDAEDWGIGVCRGALLGGDSPDPE